MIRIDPFEEITFVDTKLFEREIGFNLPADYREFLTRYNGGIVLNQIFNVPELEEDILMNIFYGIGIEKNKVFNIKFWLDKYKDEIPDNSLLIGNDPGGGFILLIVDGEESGVYYYDHSYFFEQSTDEQNTYFLSETFQEFIDSLEDLK